MVEEEFLLDLGVQFGQGYLFAEPPPWRQGVLSRG
jgi:EAL domain-containing protein (putative c-di-GMP-specific phosphodiesterase class I)